MQRQSLRYYAAFAMSVVLICVSIGISKDKITKLVAATAPASNYPAEKPVVSLAKEFTTRLLAAKKELEFASKKLTRRATFQQKIDKLMAKAQKQGKVRVIVELQVAYQSEHKLSNEIERQAQREVISETGKRLLNGLKYDLSSLKTYDGLPMVALSVDSEGLSQLQSSSYVLDVSEDKPMKLALYESLPVIGATKAWASGYTGTGQTVVILDSGVDKTHPALAGRVVAEACYSTQSGLASSLCPGSTAQNPITELHTVGSGVNCTQLTGFVACGHGTHTANAIAGKYGVAPTAKIISMQVMSYNTDNDVCGNAPCLISYTSDVIKALNYVYTNLRNSYNIASVNISLAYDSNADPNGYPTPCDNEFSQLKTAIDDLKSANIPVVIASGNDSFKDALSYPACISTAISVGATSSVPYTDGNNQKKPADTVPAFSNSASYLNLLAPGYNVISAMPNTGSCPTEGCVGKHGGTSVAAAHVSGAWALLRQRAFWVDDSLPQGAILESHWGDGWNWVSSNPSPFSGSLAHQSNIASAEHQHYFHSATQTLQVNPGDILYAWVYLDPANMPSEVMLQWHENGSFEHRSYWGENLLNWGVDNSNARRYIGPLPQAGEWVKLEVPASMVGLEGKVVNGMAFSLYGGRATWDKAGSYTSVDNELARFQGTGAKVTDTNNIEKSRIKIDVALGLNIPEPNWIGEYYNTIDLDASGSKPVVVKDEGYGDDVNGFINRNLNSVSPVPGIGTENYSVRWTRTISLPAGKYRFQATGDDGIRLYIDGQIKIDQWHGQGGATSYDAIVDIDSGLHTIRFEYYQGCCVAEVRLAWGLYDSQGLCSKNVGDFPLSSWVGEYFNNTNLSGDQAMVIEDTSFSTTFDRNGSFSKDFGSGSPSTLCNVFADRFSVRWVKQAYFVAGTYQFTVNNIDDGIRVYIDGNTTPVIDKWYDNSGTNTSPPIPLSQGNHTIKVEYYKNVGAARANISWVPLVPNAPTNLSAGANPSNPSSQITLNWTQNSGNVAVDYFKVERWNGSTYSQIGTTTSTTYTDTGLSPATSYTYRVKAHNNNAEFNNSLGNSSGDSNPSLAVGAMTGPLAPSNLAASSNSTSSISLTWTNNSSAEGVKIERLGPGNSDYAQIDVVGGSATSYSDSWLSEGTTYYYRVRAYTGGGNSAYSNTSSASTQCGYVISPTSQSFNYGGGTGSITVSSGSSCSWSATSNASWITLTSGTSGTGNGSVNYSVSNYNVISDFRDGALTVAGRTVSITQRGRTCQCTTTHLECCLQAPPDNPIPLPITTDTGTRGLTASYFSNTLLSRQPSLQRIDPVINYNWINNLPDTKLKTDKFSVRWNGQIKVPSYDSYTFYIQSNSGVRLWINNQLIINHWLPPFESQVQSKPIELKAGTKADIRVEYYNAGGGAVIRLLWSSTSIPKQIIPQKQLYPEASTNQSTSFDTTQQIGMLSPLRYVSIRDPQGRFESQALLSTNLDHTPKQIVECFILRW